MSTTRSITTAGGKARPGRDKRAMRRGLMTTIAIILVAFMLFPVYWMFNISLSPGSGVLVENLIPLSPTFDGYRRALEDQGGNLITSLAIALGSVLVTLVIATPCAYALAQFRFRWINWALLGILIAQMIPGIVIANALYTLFESIGLINTIPGLILANAAHAVPFGILIMRSFMISIPPSIVEAARVDGAGLFRAFFSIVVPVSRNSIITVGLFAFLFAWSDFLFALTLTTNDDVEPITMGIYTYLGANIAEWNVVMATAVMASIPAIVLLIIAQRYIAAGATGGAVK